LARLPGMHIMQALVGCQRRWTKTLALSVQSVVIMLNGPARRAAWTAKLIDDVLLSPFVAIGGAVLHCAVSSIREGALRMSRVTLRSASSELRLA
jgi:hypothetical protein